MAFPSILGFGLFSVLYILVPSLEFTFHVRVPALAVCGVRAGNTTLLCPSRYRYDTGFTHATRSSHCERPYRIYIKVSQVFVKHFVACLNAVLAVSYIIVVCGVSIERGSPSLPAQCLSCLKCQDCQVNFVKNLQKCSCDFNQNLFLLI